MDQQAGNVISEDICFSDIMDFIKKDEANTEMASAKPFIEIIEQPKSKVRFRYECEGRSAGSILGVNSTSEAKSYPAIRIHNYQGEAIVVVSCVTVNEPYYTHPHKLVGKEHCDNGVFTMKFENEDMKLTFTNLGIQCVKKNQIVESLERRRLIKVDPYKKGFEHATRDSINLNVVRLCFQAFLPKPGAPGKFEILNEVSDPIYDTKSNCDLLIHHLSHSSAPVTGGMSMVLLCDKVNKDDISIRFYEEHNHTEVWSDFADFTPQDVHKQYAIKFRTPRYSTFEVTEPVRVFVQLVKGESHSEGYPFLLTPLDSDLKTNRIKLGEEIYFNEIFSNKDPDMRKKRKYNPSMTSPTIKVEPSDSLSPPHYSMQPQGSPIMYYPQQPSPSGYSISPNNQPASHVQDIFGGAMMVSTLPPIQPPLYTMPPYAITDNGRPPGTSHAAEGAIFDMDTQQTHEYQPHDSLKDINSRDLMKIDEGSISESLRDVNISDTTRPDREMNSETSSLTNIVNNTYDEKFA